VLGVALLGYALLIFVVQRPLAFPGMFRDSPRVTASAPEGVTQVWLETSFGRVEAWFFIAEGGVPGPAILFAHGNGELIEDWASAMGRVAEAGVSALLVEFPGYGHSEGKPTRATIRETFTLAFDWLVEQDEVDADRIVAFGRSMGGGAAGDLSQDRPVRALVLQSTFSSAVVMAREAMVPGFLVRDRFDNQGAVADFSGPILLIHGLEDDVIPYSHAQTLARTREGLEIHKINCAHNDCAREWPTVVAYLTEFLRSNALLEQ
jgi:pimeloyl-ACP methyl ester carboxylesterase